MPAEMTGKVALITGGSSGIGKAAALAFASEGAKVVIASRTEETGEQTADRIREAGGEAIWIRTDVTRAAQVRSLVKTAAEEYCGLDFAFNNAGSGGRGGWTAESTRSDPGFRMLI